MTTSTGHRVGATYKSLYWQQEYTVLRTVDLGWADGVEVRWADGHTTKHCTDRGNDPEVAK